MNKKKILREMKKFYGNSNLRLPEHIDINVDKEKSICEMMLDYKSVRENNMQTTCNAFEGWSIAIYTALKNSYSNLTIILGIRNSSDTESVKPSVHWARFLYRAERFHGQYA